MFACDYEVYLHVESEMMFTSGLADRLRGFVCGLETARREGEGNMNGIRAQVG